MAVSRKINEMAQSSSWIRRMFEAGSKLKAAHGEKKVCDFSLGNPNIDPPAAFARAVTDILHEKIPHKHGYMPNAGYPEVREKVADYVSIEQKASITGEHVVLSCGAGGGLNVVLKTILNPGETVLASVPCFMEYAFYSDNHGGKLETVPSRADFDLDIDTIEKRITQDTAALIINSPNNPTGQVYGESTIKSLGEMLQRKSREIGRAVYLLCDEPYRKIVYDGTVVPPVFPSYSNAIIISSYSKDLSIPGERIGWIAVHPEAEDASGLINGMILCTRILGFVNAPSLMQRAVARLQGISVDVKIYKKKRDLFCDGLRSLGYEFLIPKGTFYLFPKAPGGDDLDFVRRLQDEFILTVPGRGFGLHGYFRIAFCVEDEIIERSMKGFARAIKTIS